MATSTKRNSTTSVSKDSKKINKISLGFGIALILMGAILFILSTKEILFSEVRYAVSNITNDTEVKVELNSEEKTEKKDGVVFLSPKFGLAIPKINANANVIKNVDPFSFSEYDKALNEGVAHAKTSALPGQSGNLFLFAHSAVNFYENSKYNVYFYLLPKLEKGNKIYVSYNNKIYNYEVEEVKVVGKDEIQYLSNLKPYNTLTLMTCWPAGMNISRVVVIAKEV